jgi:hypothetical protein
MITREEFLSAYDRLAQAGECDCTLGFECERVWAELQSIGLHCKAAALEACIAVRANCCPRRELSLSQIIFEGRQRRN